MKNNGMGPEFWSARGWLGRLSFSFLIIAAVLAYTGWNGTRTHALSGGRALLCYFAAMLAFVLFLMGTRERHRSREDNDNRDSDDADDQR